MKKTLFIILWFCFCITHSYAGEYSNLTPGVSTKKDANKEFGKSVRSTENGKRFDYPTAGHNLKRLSILLKKDDATIQSIDLFFEKAIATEKNKMKNENLELLGACYYQEGRLNEALNTLVKSSKRNSKSPLTVCFLAAVSDRLGNKADAKTFYKKYLRLKHDDKDMNFMAKKRLRSL